MKVTYICEYCGCPCYFVQHFRQSGNPGVPKFCPLDKDNAIWKQTTNPSVSKKVVD